jgi:hypothetical protein
MAHKWVRLSEYLKGSHHGKPPDPRTVRDQIDRQEIVGKRSRGTRGHYWVLIDEATGVEVRNVDAHRCGSPIAARIVQKVLGR